MDDKAIRELAKGIGQVGIGIGLLYGFKIIIKSNPEILHKIQAINDDKDKDNTDKANQIIDIIATELKRINCLPKEQEAQKPIPQL